MSTPVRRSRPIVPGVGEVAARDALIALLNAAPGIHVVTDLGGTIVDVAGADVRALGVRPVFLRGRSLLTYFLPTSRAFVRPLLERGEATEQPLRLELRGRRGLFASDVSVRPVGETLCWTIVREEAREPAAAAEPEADENLPRVLERLHEGIILVDRRLHVRFANAAARRTLGRAYRAGGTLPDLGPLRLRDLAARAFASFHQRDEEVWDGERAFRVIGIPPRKSDDDVVLVIADLTERERRERVQSEFVANASHELRTPLSTITGAIEILQGGAKDIPEARDRFLLHIEREVRRLGRLMTALLTLARVQAGQELPDVAPVALRPLLEDVAERLPVAAGVDVVVSCPTELSVLAHEELLLEALSNLGANASKHTQQGRIVLAAAPHRDVVSIEVRDSGSGISDELLASLFERFYRGDAPSGDGFGLGLAIVREAVAALGGGIEVDSEPGRGTTMRILLPQSPEGVA